MRPAQTIIRPVDRDGHVIRDDEQIEFLTFGDVGLLCSGRRRSDVPQITIQIAQHTDGLFMWAIDAMVGTGYRGYRVGSKWGKFAPTRQDAIAAACTEIEAQGPDRNVIDWLDSLCAPQQMELFA